MDNARPDPANIHPILAHFTAAEFIEDDEVEARQMIGDPALPAGAGFRPQPGDKSDDIEEAPGGEQMGCRPAAPALQSARSRPQSRPKGVAILAAAP